MQKHVSLEFRGEVRVGDTKLGDKSIRIRTIELGETTYL